jgi:hypothetical protein
MDWFFDEQPAPVNFFVKQAVEKSRYAVPGGLDLQKYFD